mmetsp:Transcript_27201/g.82549  ORF Transcript_27201/g.82549 Transcript_27201/m.82549 type:complete len:213 (+) Transcript_27201:4400-5038(+)
MWIATAVALLVLPTNTRTTVMITMAMTTVSMPSPLSAMLGKPGTTASDAVLAILPAASPTTMRSRAQIWRRQARLQHAAAGKARRTGGVAMIGETMSGTQRPPSHLPRRITLPKDLTRLDSSHVPQMLASRRGRSALWPPAVVMCGCSPKQPQTPKDTNKKPHVPRQCRRRRHFTIARALLIRRGINYSCLVVPKLPTCIVIRGRRPVCVGT